MNENPEKGMDYLEVFERQMAPAETAFKDMMHRVNLSEGDSLEAVARVVGIRLAKFISSRFKVLLVGKHLSFKSTCVITVLIPFRIVD